MEKITPAEVERYKSRRLSGDLRFGRRMTTKKGELRDLSKVAGGSTVNRELGALRRVLNLAVEWGVLEASPLAGKLKMLPEAKGRVRYLEPAEITRLLDACAPHLRALVELALATGMRRSEITGLRWGEVDLARKVITLPGDRCKSGKGRAIPLNNDALAVLKIAEKARLESCELIYHQTGGQPLGNIRKAWESACRRAKLDDLRFHDLRHVFASALIMRGVHQKAVQELLGHATLAMTERYNHLSADSLRRAVGEA